MSLQSLASPELIFCPLEARDRSSVLRLFAERIAGQGFAVSSEELYAKLAEREQLGSTGIGDRVAIPHCKVPGIARPVLAIGVAEAPGVEFGAVDDKPVRLFFVVISPADSAAEHLQALATISRWLKVDRQVERLLSCSGSERIYQLLGRGEGEEA